MSISYVESMCFKFVFKKRKIVILIVVGRMFSASSVILAVSVDG